MTESRARAIHVLNYVNLGTYACYKCLLFPTQVTLFYF